MAALGLVFAMTPSAHAITYEKKIANWESGNDAGGRDSSARLVAPSGQNHYKVVFRAHDEIVWVYDYYHERAGATDIDYAAVANVKIYNTRGVNGSDATYTTFKNRDLRIMVPGGSIKPGELSLYGSETETFFRRHRWDASVVSVAGFHPDHGLTDYNTNDAHLKASLLENSDHEIVKALADRDVEVVHAMPE